MQPGETLLALGAAGGVGLTAVEIGKAMGARVIAAADGREKLAVARSRGADELIDYKEESIRDRVRALTAGKGADVVYDPVGGDAFDQALRAVNWEARMLVIGFAAGRIQAVPANLILVKNISRKRRMAREQDMKQTPKKHGAQPQAAGPQFRERPTKARFAPDSPLEGNGFEPSVPRERDYAFQDRPVRSLRQFRSRDGDNFR
jgi:NADPH:quinone reductase-like Zn-dependent oxidoreductase